MKKPDSKATSYVSLGMNLAGGMILFSVGGFYLDQKRGNDFFWTIIGALFGLIYCFYELWKVIKETNRKDS
ncbi:MAG: AtpZ/AtpI family protein [Candidatus Omnitrophica bacterium]|nr:AtpZ/AtpI family protein [Candidatus Omnitrophota bacterium]MCB9748121.1 AtpZ/AtpI family protein [Candidatus Omnitrophota bacterium]